MARRSGPRRHFLLPALRDGRRWPVFSPPSCSEPSWVAAVTAASCEESRMPGSRGGTGTGQRDELITHTASKTLSLGKTSPPSGV